MVRALWLVLLTGLIAIPVQAGDYRLWVEQSDGKGADTPSAELGTPVTLWLHYLGPADLDNLDTSPWQDDFEIARGYAQRQGDMQRLRLRLTPRRTGQLPLPPLRLGGAQSLTGSIRVDAALEAGERLHPHWSVTPSQAWQGQQLRAELTLEMAPGNAHLSSTPPRAPGFAIQALPPRQQPLADGRVRHRLIWLLRPRQAGEQRIEAPMLRYVVDGVPRRRFHFPATRLPVRPLPAYVTPNVPVGDLRLGDSADTVLANGISAAQLIAALSTAGLTADAAERLDPDLGTLSRARIDDQPGTGPAVQVIYYDPGAGRLQALRLPQASPPWLMAAGGVVPLAMVGLLIWQRRRLRHRWQWWRYRRRLRRTLRHAGHARAAATSLLAAPLPGQQRPPISLLSWLDGYAGDAAGKRQCLQPLVGQLNAACYGRQPWSDADTRRLCSAI